MFGQIRTRVELKIPDCHEEAVTMKRWQLLQTLTVDPIHYLLLHGFVKLTEVLLSLGSIAISFLEIGGLFGSIASGYVTDKLMQKVHVHVGRAPFYFYCVH